MCATRNRFGNPAKFGRSSRLRSSGKCARYVLASVFWFCLACSAQAGDPPAAPEVEASGAASAAPATSKIGGAARNETDAVYALGLLTARGLDYLSLSDEEWAVFEQALRDHRGSGPNQDLAAKLIALEGFQRERALAFLARERKESSAWVAEAATQKDVEVLDSGVVMKTLVEGDGATPTRRDRVKLAVEGWLRDGTRFESSAVRGGPRDYSFRNMIPCWAQALLRMKVGAKIRLTCPSNSAYGDRGSPPLILPGSALRFELELLDASLDPANVHAPLSR